MKRSSILHMERSSVNKKRARVAEVENPSPTTSRDESQGSSEPSHTRDESKESSVPSNCSNTMSETHGSNRTSGSSSTRNETEESNGDDQSGEDQSAEETKNSGPTHDLSQEEGSIQSNQILGEVRRKIRHEKQAAPSVSNSTNDADASGDEDPEALSAPECIKFIDLNTYGFKTHVSEYGSFRSRVCVRSPLGGKPFAEFRQLLQDQGIENDFNYQEVSSRRKAFC